LGLHAVQIAKLPGTYPIIAIDQWWTNAVDGSESRRQRPRPLQPLARTLSSDKYQVSGRILRLRRLSTTTNKNMDHPIGRGAPVVPLSL
jgi:hypothetical protein